MTAISTSCAIVGGGPAGVVLGYLLARAGVDVTILEKHGDFFRDFRGDTVHPSTLEVMHELGLLEGFLKRPHQELAQIRGQFGSTEVVMADFRRLSTRCKFIAFMPQWDFLDFLAQEGRNFPGFRLIMDADVETLIEKDGHIVGVTARTPKGALSVQADLVVGADGRHSVVRDQAGFKVHDFGAPIDVLWFRLSKSPDDGQQFLGRLNYGRLLVMLDRGDYWQCAFVIRKGGYDQVRARGLAALRDDVGKVAPAFRQRLEELTDWDQVKLLTVAVDRLERWWRPGLLCIGDSAHAMSPIGGVGINLAVQDAVAAANILAGPLSQGHLTDADLQAVEDRRTPPTRTTQNFQVLFQERVIGKVLGQDKPLQPPFVIRLFQWFPLLRILPAYFIGVGARAEHISKALAAMFVQPTSR